MSQPHDCLFTLAVPEHLEEEMLDILLAHDDLVSGFSVHSAEGVGAGAPLHTTLERVRGRARRKIITLRLDHDKAQVLVERLRLQVPSPDIAWWTTSLTGFGRLA